MQMPRPIPRNGQSQAPRRTASVPFFLPEIRSQTVLLHADSVCWRRASTDKREVAPLSHARTAAPRLSARPFQGGKREARREMEYPFVDAGAIGETDNTVGLGSLPPEIAEMILMPLGPFETARAAGTSRHMSQVAREVAQRRKRAIARELCNDYDSCLRRFLLAAAEDDADTIEYIIASGAINPRRPLITSASALPQPPPNPRPEGASMVMLRNAPALNSAQQVDPYALLRTRPPSAEGWTPLAVAAAYGAPGVIARLASIGVRPQPTVEALIDGLLHQGWQLDDAARLIRGVTALTEIYPRAGPLDSADQNPLTALREFAVRRGSARKGMRLGEMFPRERGAADAVALFDADAVPIAQALLRAGYSPDERAQPTAGGTGRTLSETDLLREALRETESPDVLMRESRQEAMRYLNPRETRGPPRRAPTRAVLLSLLDFYDQQRRATLPGGVGSSRIMPTFDAMEWEGQI